MRRGIGFSARLSVAVQTGITTTTGRDISVITLNTNCCIYASFSQVACVHRLLNRNASRVLSSSLRYDQGCDLNLSWNSQLHLAAMTGRRESRRTATNNNGKSSTCGSWQGRSPCQIIETGQTPRVAPRNLAPASTPCNQLRAKH